MKCKYRVRCFSSKGAYLVLLWALLLSIVSFALQRLIGISRVASQKEINWLNSIPLVGSLVAAPLSGWLADAKFGNYKVFRFGVILMFISTVMYCLMLTLEALNWENNHVLKWIHFLLANSFFVVGGCTCVVTALPLGLDQMPDASASSITSYIAWFVCTIFAGELVSEVFMLIHYFIDETMYSSYFLVWALISVICMSIVLITNFLFKPKWLIIEPESPQALKTIYQVLKFAAKHKAPLNRSAFTYWEEDIPSRIDLGKSKYGGPFTTEQVEDVKTTFRILAITPPIFLITFSLFFYIQISIKYLISQSEPNTVIPTVDLSWFGFLGTLAYEFIIYPCITNKLPTIMKRIGIVPLTMTLVSFVCFILMLAHFLSHSSETTTERITYFLYDIATGLLAQVLCTSLLEFMCAQSPYKMRGLLVSLVIPLAIFSLSLGWTASFYLDKKIHSVCTQTWCPLILISVKTALCLIGFLLFCVVARWYKKRVRDENYSTQRVVEEVYDRYLTAAVAHSPFYGTNN